MAVFTDNTLIIYFTTHRKCGDKPSKTVNKRKGGFESKEPIFHPQIDAVTRSWRIDLPVRAIVSSKAREGK
jgi:hypothetical protein